MSTPTIPRAAVQAAAQVLELAAFLAVTAAAFHLGAHWMRERASQVWLEESAAQHERLRAYVRASVSEAEERLQAARTAKMPRQRPAPAADPAEGSP